MQIPEDFYETRLYVVVTVRTQFGPEQAISLVRSSLQCPAVSEINITGGESDFNPNKPHDKPNDGLIHEVIKGIGR
jgi:hypothetical protein